MAIQVRCDFTPGEFDVVRAALDLYRAAMMETGENRERDPADRRKAKVEVLKAADLLGKLQA